MDHWLTVQFSRALSEVMNKAYAPDWFEGKPIGTGKSGQLSEELLAAYRKVVDEAVQ